MSDPMSERYKLSEEELRILRGASRPAPTTEFAPVADLHSLDASDLECFSALRAVLERFGKLDRFGVALLHRHFDLAQGEVLLEKTDVASRTMSLEPAIVDSSDIGTIDTQWYLGRAVPLSVVKCRTNWHR